MTEQPDETQDAPFENVAPAPAPTAPVQAPQQVATPPAPAPGPLSTTGILRNFTAADFAAFGI